MFALLRMTRSSVVVFPFVLQRRIWISKKWIEETEPENLTQEIKLSIPAEEATTASVACSAN